MTILKDVVLTCPIDGERIDHYEMISCSVFGRALDGHPRGTVGVPARPVLCPRCAFPVQLAPLNDHELTMATGLIQSESYQSAAREAPHYHLHWVRAALGRASAASHVADLLAACWETGPRNEAYARYAWELMEAADAARADISRDRDEWAWLQSYIANVLRQAGEFEAATAWLDALETEGALDDALVARVTETRRHITAGDRASHFPDR